MHMTLVKLSGSRNKIKWHHTSGRKFIEKEGADSWERAECGQNVFVPGSNCQRTISLCMCVFQADSRAGDRAP